MSKNQMEPWEKVYNLPRVIQHSSEQFPTRTALASVDGLFYTYRELELSVRYLAGMLKSYGIGKGDRIALLSENSPHWGIAYFGILGAGAITVPILPDFRQAEIRAILEHAEVRILIVSGKLAPQIGSGLPDRIEMVINADNFRVFEMEKGNIVFSGSSTGASGTSGTSRAPGRNAGGLQKLEVDPANLSADSAMEDPMPDDLASIIYTSGTTGSSKGVMLTHQNIVSNAKSSRAMHRVLPDDLFLSMLPLAHTYECTIGMVVPLLNGAAVYYIDRAPTPSYLAPLLKKLAPTTMLTVPLIIEKIYRSRIKPALEKSPLSRALMKFGPARKMLFRAAARKLMVFFGGRIRFFGIGGAPLAPEVEKFLIEGKFPYAIGYGLTETSPMVAGFGPDRQVYRSVGTTLEGVTLRIDHPDGSTGEGEIVVRGPNVMKGYFRDEARTAEAFTPDGFFRTGDLGYVDRRGILYIRGRSKNMILGANGENIYPEEIEAVINSHPIVFESLVMQVRGKLVARVHLNLEGIEERFHHLRENAAEFQKQVQAKAQEALEELLVRVNQHISRNSKLHQMIYQHEPFEKTATQKIKRFLYH